MLHQLEVSLQILLHSNGTEYVFLSYLFCSATIIIPALFLCLLIKKSRVWFIGRTKSVCGSLDNIPKYIKSQILFICECLSFVY